MLQNQIFLGHAWLEKCPKLVSEAVFKERATVNDEKTGTEPYPRGSKNTRKRMVFATFLKKQEEPNACWMEQKSKKRAKTSGFRLVFEARTPRESSQKPFGPTSWLGKRQKRGLEA